jgi:hypothetical protein
MVRFEVEKKEKNNKNNVLAGCRTLPFLRTLTSTNPLRGASFFGKGSTDSGLIDFCPKSFKLDKLLAN